MDCRTLPLSQGFVHNARLAETGNHRWAPRESLGLSRKTFRVRIDCLKTFAAGWLPPESDS